MEQRLRSASSVDEVMRLVYPSYWSTLKCRSKLSRAAGAGGVASTTQAASRVSGGQTRPLEMPGYAATFLNLDVLKNVGREFGAPTNVFYKPPCVSVYRCGGCCHSEDKQCRNISTGFLSKTLFEVTVPNTHGTKPVTISVANHTQCNCLSKLDVYKQVSHIQYVVPTKPGLEWQAVPLHCQDDYLAAKPTSATSTAPSEASPTAHRGGGLELEDIFVADVCGPDKELDVDTCQCVCRQRDVATVTCAPHQHLDRNTCQCVCNVRPAAAACPANHIFNQDTCQCMCDKTCPRHQPLNRGTCSCECNESPNSCQRPPCEARRRRCETGFSFSEEVCRCVPSHWRRLD
ncbi:hypothetical protein CRUP_002750 [Coryphaenoides rupestris]|nr:hypothetical protein CRUP_002750 [Coryphaenoides rupestris]